MLTIERTSQGAWRISAVIGGQLETRQFFGYSKKAAQKKFRAAHGLAPRAPKAEFFTAEAPWGLAHAYKCDRDGIVALGDTAQEAREKWQEGWIAENY